MTAAAAPLRSSPGQAVRRRETLAQAVILSLPTVFIGLFSVTPILILFRLSFAHHEEGQLVPAGFELTQYGGLADPMFLRITALSLVLSLFTAAMTVGIAFPAVYFISQMRRRAQVAWLVFLLGALSLSEVLVVFAFQVLLSNSGVIVDTLLSLRLMAQRQSLYPNLGAVQACLVYLALPYVMLFLYPAVSKLDAEMPQAAATMGASPLRTFFMVTTPLMRGPLLSAAALVVIFTVSAYLTPLVLGRPETWTVGVHLSNTALEGANMPMAAAEAVALVAAIAALLVGVRQIGAERRLR